MFIAIEDAAMRYKGYTRYDLATLLSSEVTPSTVYSWCSGRTQPSYEHMDMLCQVLGCTMESLFIPEPYEFKYNKVRRPISRKVRRRMQSEKIEGII